MIFKFKRGQYWFNFKYTKIDDSYSNDQVIKHLINFLNKKINIYRRMNVNTDKFPQWLPERYYTTGNY